MTTNTSKRLSFCFIAVVILSLVPCLFLFGCSSSSSSNGGGTTQTQAPKEKEVAGYSVAEYNKDVEQLEQILNEAITWYDSLEAMGDPNAFSTQDQVDEYNYYVDQYNAAADNYNAAATAFSKKYNMSIDGVSGTPVDPRAIDVPNKR